MKKVLSNNKILSVFILLITFLVYFFTANKEVTFTDNGELAAACITLGISHPTGYPLFTILGHFWSLLPLPLTKIASMNLLAAVFTSFASLFLFYILQIILKNITFTTKIANQTKKKKVSTAYETEKIGLDNVSTNLISLFSAISFAFANTVWAQANSLEVYSLEIFLMNLVIFSVLKAYFSKQNLNKYILTAFLFGLAMTNHMTSILMFPAILWLYFQNENEKISFSKLKVTQLLWLLIPFFIALSLYLYLPIRSSMEPAINWGWVHRGFSKFLYHLQGKQYQIWMFSGSDVMIKNLGLYFSILPFQFGLIGLLAVIYGMIKSWKSKPIFWFLILLIIGNIGYAINYSIFDIDSYFLLSFIALFIFFAIGIAFLTRMNKNYIYTGLLILIINISLNYRENDHSGDFQVNEFTKNMIRTMDKDAIMISSQWDFFVAPFMYKQIVEGVRPDVVMIDKELLRRTWYPLQLKKWYPEMYKLSEAAFRDFDGILELFESSQPYSPEEIQRKYENIFTSIIDKNIDKRPIYITIDVLRTENGFFEKYKLVPSGFAFRVFQKDTILTENISKLNVDYFIKTKGRYKGLLPDGIVTLTGDNLINLALYCYQTGQLEKSRQLLEKGLYLNPDNEMALKLKQSLQM